MTCAGRSRCGIKINAITNCWTVVPQQADNLFVQIYRVWRQTRFVGGVVWRYHAPSRGSATQVFSEYPRGARMAMKDYSGNEALRSRG